MFRVVALGAILIGVPAHAGWFSYESYEDCLLDKMKGQTEYMRGTVEKVCSKLLHREENIGVSGLIKWLWSAERNKVTITPPELSGDLVVSRAQFSFSSKPCDQSKDDDFGRPVEFIFQNDEASARLIQPPVCMKPVDAWARYK